MNEPQTDPENGPRMGRRLFLRSAAAAGTVLAVGATAPGTAAAAPAGFPDHRYVRTLLEPSRLKYNPTGEIIFPCIRGAAETS
ncbi:hypothetical protein ACFYW1_37865 [Streptomyces sp. NPDC002669]|uniref:hypothetical protein n=1 Tax=Streptomyces sp. NPDC002669 TaxID=3364658 RepID=UPI0036B0C33E